MFQRACSILCLLAVVQLAPAAPGAPAQGTHKQVNVLTFKNTLQLRNFCMMADGHLLALFAPRVVFGPNVDPKAKGQGEIQVLDADGKSLKQWTVDFTPQSLTVGPDGSIYVAGSGRIARFDKEGKQLAALESPHVTEVARDQAQLRQAAEKQLKEEKAMWEEQLKQEKEELKKLSGADPAKLSPQDKQTLQIFQQQVKALEFQMQAMQKKTVEQAVKELNAKLADIRTITVSDKDVFLATRMVKGYGFAVWRMTHEFKEPKQIISNLSGCCGQMDIQCKNGEVFVAENSRKRVCRYDREGKLLGSWGKDVRADPECGFGGCCNPMNLCFGRDGEVCVSESDGQVKRFAVDGKYLGLLGKADVQAGCKNSTVGISPDGSRVYYYDANKGQLVVLAQEKTGKPTAPSSDK